MTKPIGPRPEDFPTNVPWPYESPKKNVTQYTPEERVIHNTYAAWKRKKSTKQREKKQNKRETGIKNLQRARNNTEAQKLAAYGRWLKQRMISNDMRHAGENLIQAFFENHREKVWTCLNHMLDYATYGRCVLPEVDQNGDFIYVDEDNKEVDANAPGSRMKERVLVCQDDAAHRAAIMQFLERMVGSPGKHLNVQHEVRFGELIQQKAEDAQRYRDETNRRFVDSVARPIADARASPSGTEENDLDAVRTGGRRAPVVPAGDIYLSLERSDYREGPGSESPVESRDAEEGGYG